MTELSFISGNPEEVELAADPDGYLPPLETDPRPDWDNYFMQDTYLVSIRTTCLARNVGAVIVLDRRIVSTGYNGIASGLPHYIDLVCLKRGLGIPAGERTELCRGCCAEENVIVQAARFGLPVKGGWIYTTHQPCIKCARMIINVGLEGVTFAGDYPQPMAIEFMQEAGVILRKFDFDSGLIVEIPKLPKRYLVTHAHRYLKGPDEAYRAEHEPLMDGSGGRTE